VKECFATSLPALALYNSIKFYRLKKAPSGFEQQPKPLSPPDEALALYTPVFAYMVCLHCSVHLFCPRFIPFHFTGLLREWIEFQQKAVSTVWFAS
jgi:hypothetical protein